MSDCIIDSCLDTYPDILNPKMISDYLGIGYAKALELVKSGAIPCIRLGNHYKIPKKCLVNWLEEPGYREF